MIDVVGREAITKRSIGSLHIHSCTRWMGAVFDDTHKLHAESEGMSLRWLSIQSGVTPNCTFPSLMRPIGGREGASRETYLMIGSILGGVLGAFKLWLSSRRLLMILPARVLHCPRQKRAFHPPYYDRGRVILNVNRGSGTGS